MATEPRRVLVVDDNADAIAVLATRRNRIGKKHARRGSINTSFKPIDLAFVKSLLG